MGVKRSTQFVDNAKLSKSRSNIPEIAIIDSSHVVHRLCKRQLCPIVNSDDENSTAIFGVIRFVMNFKRKFPNSEMICVFDGKAPKIKRSEILKRRNRQITAHNKLMDQIDANEYNVNVISTSGHSSSCVKRNSMCRNEYGKSHRNSYSPIYEMSRIKMLLKAMGITVIQANSEADSLCAYYARYYDSLGYKVTVITQDIDILLLGAKRISMTTNIEQLEFEECGIDNVMGFFKRRISEIFDINIRDVYFDIYDLQSICCLMGTDLCSGLRIFKEKLTLEQIIVLYIMYDRSVNMILESLKIDKTAVVKKLAECGITGTKINVTVDDEYMKKMSDSVEEYKSNYVLYEKYKDTIQVSNDINKVSKLEILSHCNNLLSMECIEAIYNTLNAHDAHIHDTTNVMSLIVPKYIKMVDKYVCTCGR
jgi:5'-3' exonuclease